MNTSTKEEFLEVRQGKNGKGLYTTVQIDKGETIYKPIHISIPFHAFQEIEKTATSEQLQAFLTYGWGDEEGNFILPVSIDRFVNHSITPNSLHGLALCSIFPGDEIVENYHGFVKEDYYSKLEETLGGWSILHSNN